MCEDGPADQIQARRYRGVYRQKLGGIAIPFRKEGSPFWQYDRTFSLKGKRYRVRGSTGETNKSTAREVEEAEVAAARQVALHGEEAPEITLDEAFGTYAMNIAMTQPSWYTTKYQTQVILKGLKRSTLASETTDAHLTNYIAKRRATVANATVNREIQLLRRVFNYARRNLKMSVADVDWDAHILPEPKGRVRELTLDEERRLFEHLPDDLASLVEFALLTGCRAGSAIRLEWRDVDLEQRIVVFRDMKGGEHHTIPMTERLRTLIANQPRLLHIKNVFTYKYRGLKRKRRAFTPCGWSKPWKKSVADAGIVDFRFHDLRHTAASRATRAAGIENAQKLLGHKDISTTQRYAHVNMDDLLKAMEKSEATHAQPTINKNDKLVG